MKDSYTINAPQDFQRIITDVLTWSDQTGGETVVLALQGNLGAGKTTFTQQLAKQLGVTEPVTSPTFTIMKQYELPAGKFSNLVHIDAYRFESEAEAAPLRFGEVFAQPRAIVCVEWPEYIASLIPSSAVWLTIKNSEDETRTVTVRAPFFKK